MSIKRLQHYLFQPRWPFLLLSMIVITSTVVAQERLRLATTTSTEHSGLLARLHPPFEAQHQIRIDVIATGTGKALRLGENGDIDVLMVHAPDAERQFIQNGYGIERKPLMHNDFIILGPSTDPAGLLQASTLNEALERLVRHRHDFISRGDQSGTHQKERLLWYGLLGKLPQGDWYIVSGQGMGTVLHMANEKLAYTLSDRGTYLAYTDKIDLIPVFEGGKALHNPYHIIIVHPERHPHVNFDLAQKYVAFIRGEQGQQIIRDFKKNGRPLFKPDVIQ